MGTWLCSFQGKPPVSLSPWGTSQVCWVCSLSAWFGSKGNRRGLLSFLGLRKDAEQSLGLGPAPSGLVEGPFFGGWMDGWRQRSRGDAGPMVAAGAGPCLGQRGLGGVSPETHGRVLSRS